MSDKRSATISIRVTSELESQLQAIAIAHDTTLSDLAFRALLEVAERERTRYLKLRAAFEACPDLPRPTVDDRRGSV